ncbi:Conserved_hypothetical protein [Hexamita inflata]|uniref:Transmembrane protein n=1 Tax=Hexamita inflata TaxID=28002 RepID=A0AA86PMT8_9EUKA|nr:Conserved hypothetical protein [Hexamita inflata]
MIILIISSFEIQATNIAAPIDIPECYNTGSIIRMYEDENKMCVVLSSQNNSKCNVFPKGIELTIILDILYPYKPKEYFDNFNYSSTSELCLTCDSVTCPLFWKATRASFLISSMSHETSTPAGAVLRLQTDKSSCFYEPTPLIPSQTSFFMNKFCYTGILKQDCKQYLTDAGTQLINATLNVIFADQIYTYVYLGETANNHYTKDSDSISFCFTNSINPLQQLYEREFQYTSLKIVYKNGLIYQDLYTQSHYINVPDYSDGLTSVKLKLLEDQILIFGQAGTNADSYNTDLAQYSQVYQKILIRSNDLLHINLVNFTLKAQQTFQFSSEQTIYFKCTTLECQQHLQSNYTIATTDFTKFYQSVLLFFAQNGIVKKVAILQPQNVVDSCFNNIKINTVKTTVTALISKNTQSKYCQLKSQQLIKMQLIADQTLVAQKTANFSYSDTEIIFENVEAANTLKLAQDIIVKFYLGNEKLEEVVAQKVVNKDTSAVIISMVTILCISVGLTIITGISYYLFQKYAVSRNSKHQMKQKELKDFSNIEDM